MRYPLPTKLLGLERALVGVLVAAALSVAVAPAAEAPAAASSAPPSAGSDSASPGRAPSQDDAGLEEVVVSAGRAADRHGRCRKRRLGRRRRPVRAAAGTVAEMLEVVPGLIAAQHSGSGKANQYYLARHQSRPRHGFLDLGGRRAVEPAHSRSRSGLSRRQRPDPGDRRDDFIPKGALSSRRRRFLDGGRLANHDRGRLRPPFCPSRTAATAGRGSPAATTSKVGGGTLSTAGQLETLRRPLAARGATAPRVRMEQVRARPELRTAGPSRCRATTRRGGPRSRSRRRAIGTPFARTSTAPSTRRPIGETSRWIASAQLYGRGLGCQRVRPILRLAHAVEPDLRLPDRPVRPPLDRRRDKSTRR